MKKHVSIDSYTPEEIVGILEVSKEYDFQLYVMLAVQVFTGMRSEEVLSLRWKYIDPVKNTITIREAQTVEYSFDNNLRTTSKSVTAPTKTKNSTRVLTVEDDILLLLRKWKNIAPKVSKAEIGDNDFVFASRRDCFMTYSGYRQRAIKFFKKHMSELGLFRLHRLRHAAATLAAMADVPILNIQRMEFMYD